MRLLGIAMLLLFAPCTAVAEGPARTALVGATIHTAAAAAPLVDGQIEVEDGRIAYVGARRPAPAGAAVVDLSGRHVTPGFVDAFSHLGLARIALDKATNDSAEDTEAVAADIHPLDGLDPDTDAVARARAGGVTTAAVFPASKVPIAGRGVVIKTRAADADAMVLRADIGLVVNLGERPLRFRGAKSPPQTRMGTLAMLRSALEKARAYGRKRAAHDKKVADKGDGAGPGPSVDLSAAVLLEAMARQRPTLFRVNRRSDIEAALRLAREYDLQPVLVGAAEAWRLRDRLAADQVPVLAGVIRFDPFRPEMLHGRDDAPALLHGAGVRLAITSQSLTDARNLPLLAAHGVFVGLDRAAALAAATRVPAALLGVADRVGSLEQGKDADLVVWDADPMATFTARPLRTFIDGVEQP